MQYRIDRLLERYGPDIELAPVEAMVARTEAERGPVTILVNNAGSNGAHRHGFRQRPMPGVPGRYADHPGPSIPMLAPFTSAAVARYRRAIPPRLETAAGRPLRLNLVVPR